MNNLNNDGCVESGGVGKALLGVALIGFSLVTGGGFAALTAGGLTGTIAPIAFNLGTPGNIKLASLI